MCLLLSSCCLLLLYRRGDMERQRKEELRDIWSIVSYLGCIQLMSNTLEMLTAMWERGFGLYFTNYLPSGSSSLMDNLNFPLWLNIFQFFFIKNIFADCWNFPWNPVKFNCPQIWIKWSKEGIVGSSPCLTSWFVTQYCSPHAVYFRRKNISL